MLLKITDAALHLYSPRFNNETRQFDTVALDHFCLLARTIEREMVIATLANCDAAEGVIDRSSVRQFYIQGDRLEYLRTPKPEEQGRKYGHFRPEDILECIYHYGDWPTQELAGKIELISE